MQRLVFADASGLIGCLIPRDQYHRAARTAVEGVRASGGRLLTSNYIFDEVVTRIRYVGGHAEARRVGEIIRSSRAFSWEHVTPAVEAEAWKVFFKYSDQRISFTDATSIAIMRQQGIREILSFDSDFEKVGFTLVPER